MTQPSNLRFVMESALSPYVTQTQLDAALDSATESLVTQAQLDAAVEGTLTETDVANAIAGSGPVHQAVVDVVLAESPPADLAGAALKAETHSTRVFNTTTNSWPDRAEGYLYDVAIGPESPEPTGALVDDIHWIPREPA